MELSNQHIQRKIKIRLSKTPSASLDDLSTGQIGIQQRIRTAWNPLNPSSSVFDYYIPIMISRTSEVYEFVDVKKDNKISIIERQNINPYFMEFGFFDDLSRIKPNIGSDLTPKMLDFIMNKIGNVKILTEYPLFYLRTLVFPTNTQYNNLTGIIISPSSMPTSRPNTSKLLLEGTPYDGMYNISFDHEEAGNIAGFYCSPFKNLTSGATIQTIGTNTWVQYIPQTPAKIKLIETTFDDGSWDSVRSWFNRTGYYQFIEENGIEEGDNVLDSLDKLETIWSNLISKSNYFNISINK